MSRWGMDIPSEAYSAVEEDKDWRSQHEAGGLNYMIWVNIASGYNPVPLFDIQAMEDMGQ